MQLDIQMRWKRKKEREIEENTIFDDILFKLNGGKIYTTTRRENSKRSSHTHKYQKSREKKTVRIFLKEMNIKKLSIF
jgi:hypothetical protein